MTHTFVPGFFTSLKMGWLEAHYHRPDWQCWYSFHNLMSKTKQFVYLPDFLRAGRWLTHLVQPGGVVKYDRYRQMPILVVLKCHFYQLCVFRRGIGFLCCKHLKPYRAQGQQHKMFHFFDFCKVNSKTIKMLSYNRHYPTIGLKHIFALRNKVLRKIFQHLQNQFDVRAHRGHEPLPKHIVPQERLMPKVDAIKVFGITSTWCQMCISGALISVSWRDSNAKYPRLYQKHSQKFSPNTPAFQQMNIERWGGTSTPTNKPSTAPDTCPKRLCCCGFAMPDWQR